MLDAMKSLLGGSVGSYAPQQLQPQADQNGQQRKPRPQEEVSNPAVEINLSAQALRIMEAIENGDLKLDEEGKLHRSDIASAQVLPAVNDQNNEPSDAPPSYFQPLDDIIKEVVENIESGVFDAGELEEIDRLFSEIISVLDNQATETPSAMVSAQRSDQASVQPVENLNPNEQLKAIILFSELNRLLGNVGVFFGRDLSLAKMTASVQENAMNIYDELSGTLGRDKVENMRTPQEARVDAIFRQLEQIYRSAENNLPATQAREITNFFERRSSANGTQLG